MRWSPEYSIGIPELDREHEELFRHFDRLIEAIAGRHDGTGALEIIHFLDDYIHNHFMREEKLMHTFHFPEGELHKGQHRYFKGVFYRLREEIEKNGAHQFDELQLAKLLTTWWTNHIMNLDRKLGSYLESQPGWTT